jgi:putative ABC transport system permease protein
MKSWTLALRSVAHRPGFSLTVVGLLGLGIAANTALFSVVDTVLLKPLPYPDADRLVAVNEANSAKSQAVSLIAPGRIEDWNRLSHAFVAISGNYSENVTDTGGGEPERLTGVRVAPRYFGVFAEPAMLGRTFLPEEEHEGGPGAVVISYGLWTRRYGADRGVLAKSLVIGGDRFSIVGVMPKSFTSSTIDVWIPALTSPFPMRQRDARFFSGVARMKPGVTLAQAQADLAAVQRSLGEQYPATDKGWSVTVADLKALRLGDSGGPLLLLFGAVALLLSITVTNVASLVLSQLDSRQREIAIRFSIGGQRRQIVGALLREIVWLAVTGAALGWAGAAVSMRAIAKVFAHTPRIAELRLDWRALLFAAVVSGLAALAFGLLPALRATSQKGAGALLRSARGAAGRRRILQPTLVAGQMALTMTLLAGSGLLLRSFHNLTRADLGFNPDHTLLFHVGARWDEDRTRVGRMQETIVAELNRMPGVEAAGITNFLPTSGATLRYQIALDGVAASDDTARMPAGSRTVSPGYLRALQTPLLAGVSCPEVKLDANAPYRALVNRRFVDVYARGENVVGRRFHYPSFRGAAAQYEIVGVIGDIREDSIDATAYPFVYNCARAGGWPDPEYVVRAHGDPRTLLGAIREIVRRAESGRAIFGVRTMDDAVDAALDRPRTSTEVLALFALAAMTLAAVGLYSLIAHFVNSRRQEIGVRMALGAAPAQIVGALLRSAVRLIVAGIVAGATLTVAGQRLVQSMLFGVRPIDAVSFAGAAALLSMVSVVAALIPARRAAAIDPMESMRAD